MNTSFVNTAPHHHGVDEESSRLQSLVPTTPRRKLQIPPVFETGTTPGKTTISTSKLLTNSPRKLKIPSVVSDLKSSLKPPCIDQEGEAKDVTVVPSPVEDTVTARYCGESQSDEDQSHDTVKTSNAAPSTTNSSIKPLNSTSSSSKPKRKKIRKSRSKKLTAKMQLLAEIAALEKEIQESSLRTKTTESAHPEIVVTTPEEEPAVAEGSSTQPSNDELVEMLEAANHVPTEMDAPDVDRSDCEEYLLLLDDGSESNHTDSAVVETGDDDLKSQLRSELSPTTNDHCYETPTEITVPLSPVVDSGSIQSPRSKTKTLKKLQSFFRRRKSKTGHKSGLSITDVLN
jgi:hypothetical protein